MRLILFRIDNESEGQEFRRVVLEAMDRDGNVLCTCEGYGRSVTRAKAFALRTFSDRLLNTTADVADGDIPNVG